MTDIFVLAVSIVILGVSILGTIALFHIVVYLTALHLYVKFVYAAYVSNLHKKPASTTSYESCVNHIYSRWASRIADLHPRNLLLRIIIFIHKRRHPEDYL